MYRTSFLLIYSLMRFVYHPKIEGLRKRVNTPDLDQL